MDAPKVPKLILPSLSKEQIELLLDRANNVRDNAIIALFTESGLRLSELSNIRQRDIDWQAQIATKIVNSLLKTLIKRPMILYKMGKHLLF